MIKNYRKIFERFNQCSLLPGVDIHHIDGNHDNNDPSNLQAVTIEEHYQIHRSQKDYYAAYLIGRRMDIKPEDWEQMAKENGSKSGKENYAKGIGLSKWIQDNPEQFKKMISENGKKGGKKCYEENLGFFAAEESQKKEWRKKAGEASPGFKLGHAAAAGKIGGKVSGENAKKNKTGIFALSPEKNKQRHMNSVISKLIKNGKASAWPREDINEQTTV